MVKEIDEVKQIDFPLQMLLRIIGIVCMVFYTLYHCYNGNYGLKNYMNKQDMQITTLLTQLFWTWQEKAMNFL